MEESIFPELLAMTLTAIRQHPSMNVVLLMAFGAGLRFARQASSVAVTFNTLKIEVHAI